MFEMDTFRGGGSAHGPEPRGHAPLRVFGARYRIESLLARGGMGDVYVAIDELEGRRVALKLLRASGSDHELARARFAQEAATATRLSHLRIVRTLDYGCEADGTLYLVMELLEGETLGARMKRGSPVSIRDAVSITTQILEALESAHSAGVLHRDLKPENVFLLQSEASASVKLLDFGVAKWLHGSPAFTTLETTAGTVFGTPRYMSPEQARGCPLDVRSDVYGVGVLLYQMLAGRLPFEDEDAVVVMARHIRDDPTRLEVYASERRIPRALVQIVHRALEKDPSARFGTASAFRRALLATLPAVDRMGNPAMNWLLNPGPRHRKARRWTALGVGAVLSVLAGLGLDLNALGPRFGLPSDLSVPAGALERDEGEGPRTVSGARRR